MPANPNWTRWIQASINTHFDNAFDANVGGFFTDIHKIYEGQPLDSDPIDRTVEIRIDGPDMFENLKNQWTLLVEINAFISTDIDDINLYSHSLLLGPVSALFTNIPVYKYGNQPGDDNSYLGCLVLKQKPGSRDYIETNRFGRIEPATRIEQSTVEGHYCMELTIT